MKTVMYFALGLVLGGPNLWAQTSLKSPNVSANALFLYRNSNFNQDDNSTVRNGMDLQEAEVAFFSDVDPYSRLNVLLSVHPEYVLDATSTTVEKQNWVLEPEELFAESNHVPLTTLRIGKFKAAFGKHNTLHTHAYPLIDAPVATSVLLGDEGLNDAGVSAAVLLPISWFSEITLQALKGEGENKEFKSPTPGDSVGVGHWKNLWDLSDSSTLELGASYAQGNNSVGGTTALSGADLTFKWRPVSGGKYHSGMLGTEWINRRQEKPGVAAEIGDGFNIIGQFQFAERWLALARYDHLRIESSLNAVTLPEGNTDKYSAGVTFLATEFSSFRAEYDQAIGPTNSHGDKVEKKFYLQANFTIGAHPAHSY